MKQRRTTATRSRHRAYEETRARSRPSVATVERLKDVGLLFYFTKPKCQTIGDTRLFHLPFVLATCQNPRFGKCNLANHWRCSNNGLPDKIRNQPHSRALLRRRRGVPSFLPLSFHLSFHLIDIHQDDLEQRRARATYLPTPSIPLADAGLHGAGLLWGLGFGTSTVLPYCKLNKSFYV